MFSPTELVSKIVDAAKKVYKEHPDRDNEYWDAFYTKSLTAENTKKLIEYNNSESNSGYLIDEGPSERRYNLYEDDGETLTSWGKSLYDSHSVSGYRKGISNTIHIAINVKELECLKEGKRTKYLSAFTLALINYHRRREFYREFPELSPIATKSPENINIYCYLWEPDVSGDNPVTEYQDLYDKFDSSDSVDNAPSKIQGVINLLGLKRSLRSDYFIKGTGSAALKHMWKLWSPKKQLELYLCINEFREEYVWLDNLLLNDIFAKSNPHAACYFQAFMLASKKYGASHDALKRIFKHINKVFGEVEVEPREYWSKLLKFNKDDLTDYNASIGIDMRTWGQRQYTGYVWLALESKGLHHYDGSNSSLKKTKRKKYNYTRPALDILLKITNQNGRGYQRSSTKNQEELYVALILGYIDRMMQMSNIDEPMVQILPIDREYLGDLAYNAKQSNADQKYSFMKRLIEELKGEN